MISRPILKPWLITLLTLATLLLFAGGVRAQNYSFPGNLPAGCSGSGGSYSCGDPLLNNGLSLTWGDTISFTEPATLTINGNLSTANNQINAGGLAANLTLLVSGTMIGGYTTTINANITAGSVNDSGNLVTYGGSLTTTTGSITLQSSSSVAGSITTTSGNISLGGSTSVGGSITSNSGNVSLAGYNTVVGSITTNGGSVSVGYGVKVNGNIAATSIAEVPYSGGSTYGGSLTATTGSVDLYSGSTVAGSISSTSGNISLNGNNTVGGHIASTSGVVNTGYGVHVNGGGISTAAAITIGQDNVIAGSATSTGGNISLGQRVQLNGDVSSSGSIIIDQDSTITGSLSSSGLGAIDVRYAVRINGDIATGGAITVAQNSVVSGKITGSSGNVVVGDGVKVSGTITTSSGTISLGAGSTESACVTSTESAAITLGYGASVNSVCCGSSCSTSCVINNTFLYPMPAQCTPAVPHEPVAYYRMDERQWNGAANEIIDSVGGNQLSRVLAYGELTETSSGSPPVAIASQHPDVSDSFCNAGHFDSRAYLKSNGPPAALQNSAEITMAAWVYPTVYSNGPMTIASNDVRGEFHLNSNGTIWFWTGVSELNSSVELPQEQWSHVAVTFKKGQQAIYINGVLAASGSVNADLPPTNPCDFMVGGDVDASCTLIDGRTFEGELDEVWVANVAMTQAEINAIRLKGRVCESFPTVIAPQGFNCVEPAANALNGHLYTKLSGTPFAFDVVALKDSNNDHVADAVETTYAADANRSVTVELVDGSSGTQCDVLPVLSPAVSQTLTFNQSAQTSELGRKSSAAITVSNAYPNLRCRVTDASQASPVVGCSTDSFAVRPTDFSVTSSANGTATVKAGANFSLTAASGVAGYDGTPKLDASKVGAHGGAVATGTLVGVFGSADPSTGTASGSTFNYSEVGYFKLSAQGIYDDSFTAVDSAAGDCSDDFSNTGIGGIVGCKFGNASISSNFGRFIPDHFDVSLNTPTFAPACATFSYVGQPIKYATNPVATVTAKNTAGALTRNYSGSFWKIDPNHAAYGITPSYSEAGHALTVLNGSAPAVLDNGDGSGTLSFADTTSNILNVTRGNPIAPFNAEIAMSFTLQDSDGVQVGNINGVAGGNPVKFGAASAGSGMAFSGGNKTQRWGRLVLGNTYASELKALSVPLFSEYFNGTAFVANTYDNCTGLTLSSQLKLSNTDTASGAVQTGNASMSIGAGISKATLANASLVSGDAGLSFSAPGAGNTGYIDIKGDFADLPWLLFDWDHNGAQDNSPAARATFGLYKGNSQQIYLREVY